MPTLSDIAATLSMNKTTISKALHNSSDISQATKEKVWAEAERVGYVKFKRTSALKRQLIGIICPEIISFYYAQLITEFTNHLQEKGYNTLVLLSGFSPENEKKHLAELVGLNVIGIIIITEGSDISPIVHSVKGAEFIPTVVIGLNYTSREHDTISIDEEFAIRSIVEYLFSLGHRRIGFIGDCFVGKRLEYLKRFLEANSLSIRKENIVLSEKRNEECGYEGMLQLLKSPEVPTALVAGYDSIALGAYRALSEKGLRVPDDTSIISFDDASFCKYLPCTITTVNYDTAAECRVAVAILLSQITGHPSASKQAVAIVPKLIIRESTGKPPMKG